jgi:hypothetical protein
VNLQPQPAAPFPSVQTDSSQILPGDPKPVPASARQLAWHCAFARRQGITDPIWSKRTTGPKVAPSSLDTPSA